MTAPTLEKIGEFFDRRLWEYEDHQLNAIRDAKIFYDFTAAHLPKKPGAAVLDLGCGTGLELDRFFARNPSASVTGIDLAPGMLETLRKKHSEKDLTLILGSYFDVPLGEEVYDAAVSVESLHHFTQAQKIPLYRRICQALKPGGYLILTDYLAPNQEIEEHLFGELQALKRQQGLDDATFYHFDTPLTLFHEQQAMLAGGFRGITVLGIWENTYCLKAEN